MKRVYKYEVATPANALSIQMPKGAKVIFAAIQREVPCLWAEVDPEQPTESRKFRVYGTGHEMPDDTGKYLGTWMMYNGSLVLHVYE